MRYRGCDEQGRLQGLRHRVSRRRPAPAATVSGPATKSLRTPSSSRSRRRREESLILFSGSVSASPAYQPHRLGKVTSQRLLTSFPTMFSKDFVTGPASAPGVPKMQLDLSFREALLWKMLI